jgi:hypothetical protein
MRYAKKTIEVDGRVYNKGDILPSEMSDQVAKGAYEDADVKEGANKGNMKPTEEVEGDMEPTVDEDVIDNEVDDVEVDEEKEKKEKEEKLKKEKEEKDKKEKEEKAKKEKEDKEKKDK